jgi:AhpC/TSA family
LPRGNAPGRDECSGRCADLINDGSKLHAMFKLMNGDPAPEIELADTNGQTWRLSERRGKMVVLHFCRGEF